MWVSSGIWVTRELELIVAAVLYDDDIDQLHSIQVYGFKILVILSFNSY